MTKLFAFALASTALAATTMVGLHGTPAAAQEASAGKPKYGTFGFDASGMDTSVAAGDDFYRYANGTWDRNAQIPADKARYGMFNVLDDLSKERTRTIIEEQAEDPNSRIGS